MDKSKTLSIQSKKFEEVLKKKDDKLSVWCYFLREENGQSAKCKLKDCKQKELKTGGGSTSTLKRHFQNVHKILLNTVDGQESQNRGDTDSADADSSSTSTPPLKKTKRVDDYFQKEKDRCRGLQITISRMAALDGFPFSVFCTSKDLRKALNAIGFKNELPKSPTSIRQMVCGYAEYIRDRDKVHIGRLKMAGTKFCVTFDEWTSLRNRRYLNIIIQGPNNQFWNLGLVRIKGSLTAERCLELVSKRLEKYNLSLMKDIVSLVTDGTSVMVKIGRISPTHHQLCCAHAIQLAVVDVLYPKKSTNKTASSGAELELEDSGQEPNEEDSEQSDEDGDDQIDDGLVISTDESQYQNSDVSHAVAEPLVNKVRKLVKTFRKSPLKNETLQRYVKMEHKKEINLILDSKTRWSSLFLMMERFYLLSPCIKKALIDINENITLEDWELKGINDLIQALGPLRVTVEALCRRDSSLLSADGALNFALNKLDSDGGGIAQELAVSLRRRILQRRTEYSGVFQYLHTGTFVLDEYDEIFDIPSKSTVASVLRILLYRILPEGEPDNENSTLEAEKNDDEDTSRIPDKKRKRLPDELSMELNKVLENIETQAHIETSKRDNSLLATIKKEMGLFEAGGSRGHHLQKAYEYLKLIKPTSVESERAFSSAGYVCNKVRSRLNDDTLDDLCFLRSYFKEETTSNATGQSLLSE